ncbi:MAG TPA: helix-turn-helix transcriptional regulator [Solirubrobacterales bacterium]|nr:helix-turn-helix transcriptional regulator [Solirubrobacterales bacterium]
MAATEIGRRVRAARAYAGFRNRATLAQRLELSKETLQRIEGGEREVKRSELLAIAEACEVPMWFLEGGWEGWSGAAGGGAEEPAPHHPRDLRRLGTQQKRSESA